MDAIQADAPGLTVEAYAARKGFDAARLARWGVVTTPSPYNGEPCVSLPYYDLSGQLVRTKHRTPTGTVWDQQKGVPLILYGLWWLPKVSAARPVILVEGESDCHSGWTHGRLVLGLPGAATWKQAWAALVALRTVYVWREPDAAGTRMVAEVAADLPNAKVIHAPSEKVKDLAGLHLAAGDAFDAEFRKLLTAADPIRNVVIPKPKARPDIRVWREPSKRSPLDPDRLDVEKAKSVPLDQLMRRLGFELKRRGREYSICCPFHEDRSPSLRINPAKGTWYCDPCRSGGDAIEFLMRWRGLTFPDAVRAVVAV